MRPLTTYKSVLGLSEQITSAISYPMGLGAVLFLITDKGNNSIRFHSTQAILYSASFSGFLLSNVIFGGGRLVDIVICSMWLFGIVIVVLSTLQSKQLRLPIIGEIASRLVGVESN